MLPLLVTARTRHQYWPFGKDFFIVAQVLRVSIAPSLYSIPLFTVYTGKNSRKVRNLAADSISVQHVIDAVGRTLRAPAGADRVAVH